MKIGFKFQFLGKISNISTSDPQFFLGQFQHWEDVTVGRPKPSKNFWWHFCSKLAFWQP